MEEMSGDEVEEDCVEGSVEEESGGKNSLEGRWSSSLSLQVFGRGVICPHRQGTQAAHSPRVYSI